ncbi:MAG: SBBP repeat-containing protein, partial [Bacteroidia bacterium]
MYSKVLICFLIVSQSVSAQYFRWAKSMGSNNVDVSRFVAVDGSGNVYTTGYFQNTADFDPGLGTSFLSSQGGNDIYISKLDANGNFVWARRIGGWGDDYGLALTLDNSGNVFVTGSFQGTNVDFDPGPGFFPLTAPNGGGGPTSDAFVLKLDGSGVFQWARRLGGNADDQSFGITLDNQGNVLTTGYFQWTADFDPGAGTNNLTSAGSDDIFVSKLNGLGNFVWARRIGGTNQDRGYALATDASTNIVV